MTTVRYSVRGISRAYKLSPRQVKARLRQMDIQPRCGTIDNPLYDEQAVKTITAAKLPKK